mmetsp:Transcript_19590/g.29315  ORF Transcript_19590/g.29315 Transcript_19590/m.29315 type:complete len:114 (+) Transcript_19590:433-774(+)
MPSKKANQTTKSKVQTAIKQATSGHCQHSDECVSGHCVTRPRGGKRCAEYGLEEGDECDASQVDHGECEEGLSCQEGDYDDVCLPEKEDGEDCWDDSDCKSGNCGASDECEPM